MQFAKTDVQRDIIRKINTTELISGSLALPPGTPEKVRKIFEKALLRTGKDKKFQRKWERFVLRGTKFRGVFSGSEVLGAVRIYMTWDDKVLKAYKRLGFEAP